MAQVITAFLFSFFFFFFVSSFISSLLIAMNCLLTIPSCLLHFTHFCDASCALFLRVQRVSPSPSALKPASTYIVRLLIGISILHLAHHHHHHHRWRCSHVHSPDPDPACTSTPTRMHIRTGNTALRLLLVFMRPCIASNFPSTGHWLVFSTQPNTQHSTLF